VSAQSVEVVPNTIVVIEVARLLFVKIDLVALACDLAASLFFHLLLAHIMTTHDSRSNHRPRAMASIVTAK
jgi:hypothetical protein